MNLYPDEAPTSNDLAEIMGCSRQNVKQILDGLCKKDFIVLKQDANDKRKQLIYRTKKLEKLSRQYFQKEKEFMQILYNGISDKEIRTVYKIISRMEENLKKIS